MATPDSPVPAALAVNIHQSLEKLVKANRSIAAATLAAAIINARGKPTSIQEAIEITQDINFAMHPAGKFGAYQEWLKTKEQRLAKVYG